MKKLGILILSFTIFSTASATVSQQDAIKYLIPAGTKINLNPILSLRVPVSGSSKEFLSVSDKSVEKFGLHTCQLDSNMEGDAKTGHIIAYAEKLKCLTSSGKAVSANLNNEYRIYEDMISYITPTGVITNNDSEISLANKKAEVLTSKDVLVAKRDEVKNLYVLLDKQAIILS